MPKGSVATTYADLVHRRATFEAAIGEAQGEMRKFSASMREETQKPRESVRLLSEGLGLGIPRGLQRIISQSGAVRTAMNFAFEGVVVLAGKVLIDVTEKIAKFISTAENAGTKFSAEMRKMTGATAEENDKLALSIGMMKAHLAEIEKKPAANSEAIALAEARVQADELAKSLSTDLEGITKLFAEKGLGNISAFITGQTGTDDVKKMVKSHVDAINGVDFNEQDKLSKLSPTDAAGRKKVQDDAQVERLKKAIKAAVDDVTSSYNKLHEESVNDQALQNKEGLGAIQGHDPHRSDAAMAILGTTGHQFQEMYNQVALRGQAPALTAQTESAEAHNKGLEQAKEADEKFLKDRQDRLKEIEATNSLSLQQEKMYWDAMARIPGLSAGSRNLMNLQGTDVQDKITKQNSTDANNHRYAFIRASFEAQRKQIDDNTPEGPNAFFETQTKADKETTKMHTKAALDIYDGVAEDLKQKEHLAELLIKIEEADGRLSHSQAAQQLQALHAQTDAETAQAFTNAQQAGAGFDLNQASQMQGEAITRSVNDAQNVARYSFSNKMTSDLNDWIEKSTDLRNIMGGLLTESINQVNDAIIKLLTTKNDPHPFRAAGHAIFSDVAKQDPAGQASERDWRADRLRLDNVSRTLAICARPR
jgi:hypothetical protein